MLSPYKVLYPKLIENLSRVIADLGPICTYQEVNKVLGRLKGLTELEPHQMWNVLYEIGIIGRLESDIPDASPSTGRYAYAKYHCVEGGQIGAATEARYCFHPSISKYYGLIRSGDYKKCLVYPDGIEEYGFKEGV